ncbi:hypothetical protein SCODD09_00634 [Streptococcus constellatus]|nr:hypothetical protein SCODD09_00634 [Streptococcus constellatus]
MKLSHSRIVRKDLRGSVSEHNSDGAQGISRVSNRLPQTGETNGMTLSLLGGTTILSLLGVVQMRRKKDE